MISAHYLLGTGIKNLISRLVKKFKINIIDSIMDCAICLAPPENPETVPCCKKIFCSGCLKTWIDMRSMCPLCVSPLG